jgi:Ca2+:H+ antiporter
MRYLYIAGYLAIPLAYIVHYWLGRSQHGHASWEPTLTFSLAALGVIPLAHLMGESTEHLSDRTGPTWGGLLNATFGNAAELIIGIIALTKGLNDIVKASLTGSILGNLLLVAGGAMVAGGWNREKQTFSKAAAESSAGLLLLAVAAMLFPAIFHHTYRYVDPDLYQHEHGVSIGTSVILLLVYGLGLVFTLRTHSHVFSRKPAESDEDPRRGLGHEAQWSVKKSLLVLLVAATGIGFVSDLLVGSVEKMATDLGWNHIFVGVILLAIIGNAAEHSTALLLAARDDMDTAMTISYQSSLQIALFVVPVMVLLSAALVAFGVPGTHNLDLLFSPMEVVGVLLAVLTGAFLGLDGESNWFEGVLLLGLYAVLAIVFFYIPNNVPAP